MKKSVLTFGVVLLLAAAASAATYNGIVTIDTATDEGAADTTIGSSGTGNVTTITSTGSFYNLGSNIYIGYNWNTETSGTLVVEGALGSDSNRSSITIARGGAGASGALTINGGSVYCGNLYLVRSTNANAANLTLNSGLLDVNGAQVQLGYYAGGGVYTQTGGTANLGAGGYSSSVSFAGATNSTTTSIISGGTLNILGSARLGAGSGSTCRFEVQGSAATIVATSASGTSWVNTPATTTLAFVLDDSANHISKIQATGVSGGATIDMDLNGYTPNQNDVFDLFTDNDGGFPSVSEFTLSAGDVGTWELQLSSDSSTLQAKYLVPEPATMGLLAVGGLALLRRRREQRR